MTPDATRAAHPLGVAIDFDGVIHSYVQGWTGGVPQDPPVPGALEFVQMLVARGYEVTVHTTRASTTEGHIATIEWLARYGFPRLLVTNQKPKAILYIDDRALRFRGSFNEARALLDRDDAKAACESWNKRADDHPSDDALLRTQAHEAWLRSNTYEPPASWTDGYVHGAKAQAASPLAGGGPVTWLELCAKHKDAEVIPGPFCAVCTYTKAMQTDIERGRETEAAYPTRAHPRCPASAGEVLERQGGEVVKNEVAPRCDGPTPPAVPSAPERDDAGWVEYWTARALDAGGKHDA